MTPVPLDTVRVEGARAWVIARMASVVNNMASWYVEDHLETAVPTKGSEYNYIHSLL